MLVMGCATSETRSPTQITVVARNLAFESDRLEVAAGTPFSILFENANRGIPHNVAIYADAAAEHAHFVGQTTIGSATIEYHVASLPQGTYLFRCDIHPRDMAGALVVGAASGE